MELSKLLELTIKWPIDMTWLEQLTDDLKAPQKAPGPFFGPSVS